MENSDNEETAKSIVKEYMKLKGFEEDEIDETVDLYDENGTLSKRAIKARDKIVESLKGQKTQLIEDQKKETETRQQELESQKKNLKKTISNFDEIIPGVKLNDKVKDDIDTALGGGSHRSLVVLKALRQCFLEAVYLNSVELFSSDYS